MQTNKDYRFKVSISQEKFINKEIANAMTASSKSKSVREIRKKYGYRRGVSYDEATITPSKLLNKLLDGHSFCHCFNTRGRKDKSFGSSEKTFEKFKFAYCIGVDIDKTTFATIQDYLDRLSIKPTFWYSSFSHNKPDSSGYKGCKFRMVYVFDQPIENVYWFRYISKKLLDTIEQDTAEEVKDKCSLSAAQYFNGTNIYTTKGVEYGCTEIIYGLEDIIGDIIPFSYKFISYLEHFCDYATRAEDNKREIKKLLERLTEKEYTFNPKTRCFEQVMNVISSPIDLIDDFEFEVPDEYVSEDMKEILWFWDNKTLDEFKRIRKWNLYRDRYPYIYRLERTWDKEYQIVDNDYFSLPFYPYKIIDGRHRRKTLYQRCCLRKYMYPNISKNELIVSYIIDVIKFIDDPNKDITSEVILRNVVACMGQTIEDIEKKYRKLIDHYKLVTRPKRNIIRKDKTKLTKEFTFSIIDDFYNEAFTINENHERLKLVLPFSISLNYLYQYTKTRGFKNDRSKITDNKLKDLINPDLSGEKNLEYIRSLGYKCKKDRLYRLLKDKKNEVSLHPKSANTVGEADCITYKDSRSSSNSSGIGDPGKSEELWSLKKERETTLNVEIKKGEKDKKVNRTKLTGYILCGITDDEETKWEDRYKQESKRYSTMNVENVLDDIVSWCDNFLGGQIS